MSTNGVALPNVPGRGSVSFPGSSLPMTVTLDKGSWFVILSQQDAAQPQGITITDNLGNVEYFNGHNAFGYRVGSQSVNPLTIALDSNNPGLGIDQISINPAMASEDARTGGL